MQQRVIGTSQKRTMDDFERYLNRMAVGKAYLIKGTLVHNKFGSKLRELDNETFVKSFKQWSKHKTAR